MISWSEDTGLQLGNNYPERIDPFSLVKIWILIFLTKPCILCRVFLEICFYVWIIIPDLIWGLFNWVSYIKNQSKKNYQSESKKLSQRGANECSRQKQANCPKSGKTQVTKLRLVLVLHLIGWENGASELDQSQSDRSRLLRKFINKRFLNTMKENAEERITIDEMLLSGNYVRRWAYPIFERRSWIFR